MPRYFFHVLNDTSLATDAEGQILPDMEAACIEARRILGAAIAGELIDKKKLIHLTVMIDDQDSHRVANMKAVTNVVTSQCPFAA